MVWAVRRELARKPLDVLARRMGLAFLDQAKAREALPKVVELMGRLLGWGEEERALRLKEAEEGLPGVC